MSTSDDRGRTAAPPPPTIVGDDLSLGRDHGTATRCAMREFGPPDPFVAVALGWPDGASVRYLFEGPTARADALAYLKARGWRES